MTVQTALRQGTRLLEEAGIPAAKLTAEVLLCHALHQPKSFLYSHPERELREVEWLHYGRYLHERLKGKPTQYITRVQEFYGREFRVSPAVLIPRPETEHLVERAIAAQPQQLLDVGCGSGAIAVTVALETAARVCAADISTAALDVAAGNAERLGADVSFVACDLLDAFACRSFDVIVSNPPYIPLTEAESLQREVRDFEPRVALFGGETGLDIYARLIGSAPRVLQPGGWLMLELGFRSLEGVRALLGAQWDEPEVVTDLAGLPRVLAVRLRD